VERSAEERRRLGLFSPPFCLRRSLPFSVRGLSAPSPFPFLSLHPFSLPPTTRRGARGAGGGGGKEEEEEEEEEDEEEER
jgi:hypothetical protein